MANNNAPFGFSATRALSGYAVTGASDVYQISATNTTKIYAGDPVTIDASGNINVAVSTTNPVLPVGIFGGCEYYDTSVKKPVWFPAWLGSSSATGTVTAWVITDTKQVFEVQSSGANLPYTSVGANANFLIGTGNNNSGMSGATLDQASLATTNTLPFRIVGLSTRINNDNTASYNIVEVVLNDAFYNQLTGV